MATKKKKELKAPKLPTFDLLTKAGLRFREDLTEDAVQERGGICGFTNGDTPLFTLGKYPVLSDDNNGDGSFLVRDGVVYWSGAELREVDGLSNFDSDAVGVVLPPGTKRWPSHRAKKSLLLLTNGDEDRNQLAGLGTYPTISFQCLARFYGGTTVNGTEQAKQLASGAIRMIDYSADKRVKVSEAAAKTLSTNLANATKPGYKPVPVPPPAPGFTALRYRNDGKDAWVWHRSGNVLLRDVKDQKSFLFGQDENAYFGVELPGNPQSIDAAFTMLMPAVVRAAGSTVKRQGEWFMTPIPDDEVPQLLDRAATMDYVDAEVTLPKHDVNSASHDVRSDGIVIGKDGVVYARHPRVIHQNGDHIDMQGDAGWYRFDRNTAIRAFSVEGVD